MIGSTATQGLNKKISTHVLFRQTPLAKITFLMSFTTMLFTTVLHAAPTTPTGVRVDVYSDTSLELFWDRANINDRVSGYELNKNGDRIWLGDVTSYFDSTLNPEISYNYALVAVDENGGRSNNSRVVSISMSNRPSSSCSSSTSCTSVSFAESQPFNGAEAGDGGDVNGVSLSIYSNSAAELFWENNSDVSSYDIYRDDVYLERTNGRSYYDSNRVPGRDHRYRITAIGIGGNQLDGVEISNAGVVTGPGSTGIIGSASSSSSSSSSSSTGSAEAHGISVSVYSSSSGEIFWSGNSAVGAKYDVYRNGSWVATINGKSYYDAGLSPNSYYEYRVFLMKEGSSQLLGSATIVTGS